MNDTLVTLGFAVVVIGSSVGFYLRSLKLRDQRAQAALEKGQIYTEGPKGQHPHIDVSHCIGCQGCTMVCPEGDVLAMVGGKAAIVNAHKCIGHSLCAEACPVGAITIVRSNPSLSAELPYLSDEYETSVRNLFIVGELGGLALIKNAVSQGRDCIDTIAQRLQDEGAQPIPEVHDVIIVGAGPAGIAASLQAIVNKLDALTIERDEIGGTVAKYPRQKLVMTSPVEFPIYGKFKKTELSKEALLTFWDTVMKRADLHIRTHETVESIRKGEDGIFSVISTAKETTCTHRARAVIMALGRTGTPRKLGVPGEELPKVMYRLIEADHYINKKIIVVGGGDSAIEAAMGLGQQRGNKVILSYRKDRFSRIKERNETRIAECIRKGTVEVIFNSVPVEIREDSVLLDVGGEAKEIPNDFVWVFAGGVPPNDFLKKCGIAFGDRDITVEASAEKKLAGLVKLA